MRLIKQEDIKKLDTDMKESRVSSNLVENFPPICKQDAVDVQLYYIDDYLKTYGEEIHLEDIPDIMYGGALPVAKSRKTKRKCNTLISIFIILVALNFLFEFFNGLCEYVVLLFDLYFII